MENEEATSSTLFVAEIPPQFTEADFSKLFASCEGVLGTRLRHDRNDNLVGFVDFEDEDCSAKVKRRYEDGKFNALTQTGMTLHYSRHATRNRGGGGGGEDRGRRTTGGGARRTSLREGGREGGGIYDNPRNSSGRQSLPGQFDPHVSYYSPFPHHPSAHPYSGGGPNVVGSALGFGGLPPDASATLFVEGVAQDATEREVAHIFRPFPGYQSVRMFQRESRKYPNSTYLLCFVEFDNQYQSTSAMQMLQGYKFDKNDMRGLRISYANSERKNDRGGRRGNGGREESPDKSPRDEED